MSEFITPGDPINAALPASPQNNSAGDMIERSGGRRISVTKNITGTGALSSSIFKINGSVKVIDAYGEIDSVTTLTNLTALKFYLDDGTANVDITLAGAVLSGMPAGTLILKTGDSTNVATVVDASQCQVTEADSSKKTHHPFIVTQKNGVDTYIKMSCSTTDNPVDFTVTLYIDYVPMDGGSIEAV